MNELSKSKADGDVCEKNMFVGMDVHKNYLQVAVLDERGKVLDNSRGSYRYFLHKERRIYDKE